MSILSQKACCHVHKPLNLWTVLIGLSELCCIGLSTRFCQPDSSCCLVPLLRRVSLSTIMSQVRLLQSFSGKSVDIYLCSRHFLCQLPMSSAGVCAWPFCTCFRVALGQLLRHPSRACHHTFRGHQGNSCRMVSPRCGQLELLLAMFSLADRARACVQDAQHPTRFKI